MSIPIPRVVNFEAAYSVRTRLAQVGYSERGLGDRLGRNALGLPLLFDNEWREVSPVKAAIDPLIGLLLMGEEVKLSELSDLLTADHILALEEMRIIEVHGPSAKSDLKLFPCRGLLLATDNEIPDASINKVSCLFPDAYVLSHIIDRPAVHNALDLCTGSGVYALHSAGHAQSVLGVDISERAVAFSRFNADFNQIQNAEFEMGDLYEPIAAGTLFDVITANPPFNPEPDTPAGAHAPSPRNSDHFSGGRSGEELLSRVISGLDGFLSPTGVCHIVTLLVHPKQGPAYRERISEWLEGRLSDFDVLIWAVPYNHFEKFTDDPSMTAFLRGNFERFEFGTISIRRRTGKEPIYYHGLPPHAGEPLFNEDGIIRIKIDKQAFASYAPDLAD